MYTSHAFFQPSTLNQVRILVFAALLACFVPAFADGPNGGGPNEGGPDGEPPSTSWSLGLGVISAQNPYAGMERETKVVPMIQFETKYLRLRGLGLELKLPELPLGDNQKLNFSIVARRAMGGYEAGDAPILSGMAERKSGFWAGAKVEWETSLVDVSADWTTDTSSDSNGQKFSLGVSRSWHLGEHVMLIPSLSATWQDSKYNDYYFGVRNAEALPNRAAYQADSGVNTELGLTGIYLFDQHHSLMLNAGVTRLSKEITNSPLVDRTTENRIFAAYLYRF